MAIGTSIATTFDDMLNQEFRKSSRWNGLCGDVTARVSVGRYLQMDTLDNMVSLNDYVAHTAIADPDTAQTRKRVLDSMERQPYTHFELDDTESPQVSFEFISERAQQEGQRLALDLDAYLRGKFTAAVSETQSGQAAGNVTIPAANQPGPDTGGVISVAAANFGEEAHKTKIFNVLLAAYLRATRLFWPTEGRFVVTTPEYASYMLERIEQINAASLRADIQTRALLDAQFARARTWEIIDDPNIDDVRTAGTERHPMYFGLRGRTIVKAQPYRRPENFRHANKFADVRRQLWIFGAMRRREDFALYCPTTVT